MQNGRFARLSMPRLHRINTVRASESGDPISTVMSSIRPTGVPVLQELLEMSLADATAHSLLLVTRILIISAVGSVMLAALYSFLGRFDHQRGILGPLFTPLSAFARPLLVLLPIYCGGRVVVVLSALAQTAAIKNSSRIDIFLRGHGETLLWLGKWITQILQDTTELLIIIGAAWSAKRLKDRFVSAVQLRLLPHSIKNLEAASEQQKANVETPIRLLDGLSKAMDWLIFIIAAMRGACSYGIDVRPLLASLGASSIVIGFASQNMLSNLLAGLTTYASGAFVIGDRIEVVNQSGTVIAKGVVQLLAPTKTIIKEDSGSLMYVNNADLNKMIIRNESQAVVASSQANI